MEFINDIKHWHPFLMTFALGGVATFLSLVLLSFNKKRKARGRSQIVRDLMSFVLLSVWGIGLIYISPVDASVKDNTFKLIGLFLTVIAFSGSFGATKNAFAGMVLKFNSPFVPKDILLFKNKGIEGWVISIGNTSTKIQNEYGDIVYIPNSVLSNSEYTKINHKGTFIHHRIGLGYDLDKSKVKEALEEAAKSCGLDKVAVLIHDTLDHVINYEVRGYLLDVENYFAHRAHLKEAVVDSIHSKNFEITSPSHMIIRQADSNAKFMHKPSERRSSAELNEQIREASEDATEKKESFKIKRAWEELEASKLDIEKKLKDLGDKEKVKKKLASIKQDSKTLEETQRNPECHTLETVKYQEKMNEYEEELKDLNKKVHEIGELELDLAKVNRKIESYEEFNKENEDGKS